MINFFGNKEIVNNEIFDEILTKIITPRLEKRGLNWNGKHLWFSQNKESIRQLFQYSRLKGDCGIFTWGVCLDYIPTISGKKLRFHRTEKSLTLHLFEWTDEYSNSFYVGNLDGGIITHSDKKKTEKSIVYLLNNYEQKIFNWLENANSLEKLIEACDKQIKIGKSYNIHYPSPKYVMAFLQAKNRNYDLATSMIKELKFEVEIEELLLKQILKTE